MPRSGDNYDYPAGTLGISGQTIFSARYNAWVEDIKATLNLPLPVSKGGTGASNISGTGGARDNLNVPAMEQKITNWALMEVSGLPAEQGFVWSDATTGIGAPFDGHPFAGVYYWGDVPTPPAGPQNAVVIVQDLHSSVIPAGISYMKTKRGGGAWSAWTISGSGQFVLKSGDTMSGPLIAPVKGNQFGIAGGAGASTAVALADANLVLYNNSPVNWCGMGTDGAGQFWLRTGISGTPLPALRIDSNQNVIAQGNIYAANSGTTGAYHFGTTGTKSFSYDGTNYSLAGGGLIVGGGMTVSGTLNVGGVAASGNVNAVDSFHCKAANSSSNAHFWYDNEAGTPVFVTYWNRSGSSWEIQAQGGGNVNFKFLSNNICQLGIGFQCRTGAAGAFNTNIMNFFWSSPNVACYVDNSNVGNIQFISDYRTKKDVEDLPGTWDAVKGLRPVKYTQADYTPAGSEAPLFVADDIERWGFVAHELQETLIEHAATGHKDAPDYVQSPNPWVVIAALTKALQEAMTRIEALEARQ